MVLIEAWMSQGELVTEPTAERIHLSAPSEQPPVMSCRYMKMPVHTLTTSTVWKQPGADALQRTFLPPFKGHVLAAIGHLTYTCTPGRKVKQNCHASRVHLQLAFVLPEKRLLSFAATCEVGPLTCSLTKSS